MKKRVLSALLVLCMACSMVSTVWAANEQATPETADKPASVLLDDSQSAPVTNAPAQDQDVAEGLTALEDEESGQQSDVDTPDASQPEQAESTGTPVEGNTEYTAALEQDGQALNVIVTAPEGAFDEGVEPKLSVSAIEDETALDTIASELEGNVEYDGFAALDISFKNEAGEEIEPNVPVTVRIELPDSIVDSGIDLSTLAVQHLAEDESGNVTKVEQVASVADGSIALSEEAQAAMEAQAAENAADDTAATDEAAGVAPMMLAANNALTDATAEAAAVAEFEVSGFSPFTITWSSGQTTYFRITVHYVNENGEDIPALSNQDVTIRNVSDYQSQEYDLGDYVVQSDTYDFAGQIKYSQPGNFNNSKDVTRMVARQETNQILFWETTTRYLTFYNGSTQADQLSRGENDGTQTAHIYLVYKDKETTPQTGFYIDDTVMEYGLYTVQYNGEEDIDLSSYTFSWSRILPADAESETPPADDAGWTQVERQRVSGSLYNLTEDGRSLNVSLDAKLAGLKDDERLWYQVEIRDENSELVDTLYQHVLYYIELQNGSFETPKRADGQHNVDLNVSDEGVIWNTTDKNKQIEIINPNGDRSGNNASGTYGTHGVNAAPDENQIAELNADSEGTLYQDVLTIPRSTVHWSLMHRARNRAAFSNGTRFYSGYDTMYVIIMSANAANEVTTQPQVREIIEAAGFVPTQYYQSVGKEEQVIQSGDYEGTVVWRITDYVSSNSSGGANSWTRYLDDYKVPDGQYLTRFLFAAGATGYDRQSGRDTELEYTVGNLLDDVAFTTDILEPNPGQATVAVTKTVNGLTDEELANYSVTFTVTNGNETVGEITVDNFGEADPDGNSTATGSVVINLGDASNMAVTIAESDVEQEGYTCTTTSSSAEISGGASIAVTLSDQKVTGVAFTNTYESTAPETVSLTLTKTFAGLTDAEVNYLLFGQGDDGFGWDINYCQPELREDVKQSDGQDVKFATYMADSDAVKGITLPDGTEVTGGGDFRITAQQFLSKTGTYGSDFTETGLSNIDEIENQEQGYTNQITHASLKKEFGNWVYSVTLEVPAVEDGYYYTVFEQHGEVPGYAKLDDSNVEYAITGIEGLKDGTGKFIDTEANNVYVDMDDEVEPVKVTVNDEDYTLDGEEAAIHQGVFQKLYITNDATIEFTNHYTGNLKVSKTVSGVDEEDLTSTELVNKQFTITLKPYDGIAHLDLLDGREIRYTISHRDGTTTSDSKTMAQDKQCAIEVTLKDGDTITFEEIPAIQYTVTEKDPEAGAYDFLDYTWQEATYAETMTGFGDEQKADEHWNHNGQSASIPAEEGGRRYYTVIGTDKPGDRIVSVDSMISIKPEDERPVETLQITNKYVAYKSLTIEKDVTGNLSDPDDTFTFTISGATGIKPEDITNSGAENVKVSNGTITATLGNGDTITIDKLTSEHTLTISEDAGDYDTVIDLTETDGYVDGTDHDGFAVNSKQVTVTVADVTDEEANGASLGTVRFENKKSVTPPTGLESNHTRPYTLMVTAAGIAGLALIGGIVNRRIRRRREE